MKARSWLALIAGLAVCLATGYAAYTLADYSWNQVVDYRGPYVKVALPAREDPVVTRLASAVTGPDVPVGRTVFVIIDGLREDVSRTMPALQNLRAHGFDAVVRTSQPSLSIPNWTTLLSGASQRISGVTTNWFEERVPVETLVDVALAASRTVAVSAPADFEMLYGVRRTGHVFLRDWEKGDYMTGGIVDNAIRLQRETSASLLVVHLPDVDEAGHASGGGSKEYRDTALKVDADLGRLVAALQGPDTTFIVTSDHGHIDTGGHGGPEDVVTFVPAVFAGAHVRLGAGSGTQDQVAPTVALLAQLPAPRHATEMPLEVAAGSQGRVRHPGAFPFDTSRFVAQQADAYRAYSAAVTSGTSQTPGITARGDIPERSAFESATTQRLVSERASRLPLSLAVVAVCMLVIVAVGVLSWRALVSTVAGTAAYYIVYDGLYFVVHGYRWSLSSFNAEEYLKPFLNGRMTDAVIAGVVAAAVAAFAYAATRQAARRPKGEYLPGWLALGVATVLVIQATIALQVAWYLWWWGASVTWYVPDLALGFKYDLDLVQLTGLAGAALLAPVVTYMVGRYHPLRGSWPSPATDAA